MTMNVDVITREVIRGGLEYIAEEMGIILRNAAYSTNIKERMDHSCALFDYKGRMLAQAEHIPVHLGAMPIAVRSIEEKFAGEIFSGDSFILNDPYLGGTHLPDITIITPIFSKDELAGYSVSRAHHNDIGGMAPGSMPGNATEIFQEGLRIPPVKFATKGAINKDILDLIMTNSRTPKIRKGDLMAQLSSNWTGEKRLQELIEQKGMDIYKLAVDDILNYSEKRFLAILNEFPESEAIGKDYMDGDGIDDKLVELVVNVKLTKKHVTFDFTGTAEQVKGAINCPYAVTLSGSYYVLRAITDPTIPANEGLYRHLSVIVPEGTVLNARSPAAVVGGNVETSQRIVDTLLKAFAKILPDRIPAASQGTMNNLIIGGTNQAGQPFTFYETIGGGAGGRPTKDGIDGIHSHMTNTMNTPIEEIEVRYPLIVEKYAFREGSCGKGRFRGGLGIIRQFRTKVPVVVSLLGERQKVAPWGLAGGKDGKNGTYYIKTQDGKTKILPGKTTTQMESEEVIVIETPGGGAWGDLKKRDEKSIQEDKMNEKVTDL
ncbi:MAG: hydantoinase B/oxoprolinase family protein [Candidatus Heimdallarchaeota archaeon]|nr:hydantoinase B/oxoprolinase family protein [Candidatus Heimdallarchaeota archaeon]MBY8994107.1 hydantoinase B/oxoprolinase family protein [Candidatus Heimdallarchaeota archaeon]